ncbi:MAG: DUF2096 domain-containing protein [Candidatus Bathyarchaeota archaeon]|nr:DUF2096 domain-containing protein [Candidatus Termiticorpusculum sp.]
MGHTMAVWRVLEDLLVELRKKDVQIPVNILEDLRAARSMIDLSYSEEDVCEAAVAKAEAYTTNVEAYLISQAQAVFEPALLNEWFNRLKEAANLQQTVNKETATVDVIESRFAVGVPRNQNWIRIETDNKLFEEYVFKLAEKWNLTVNKQADKRLIVYGCLSGVKSFIKQIANQTA